MQAGRQAEDGVEIETQTDRQTDTVRFPKPNLPPSDDHNDNEDDDNNDSKCDNDTDDGTRNSRWLRVFWNDKQVIVLFWGHVRHHTVVLPYTNSTSVLVCCRDTLDMTQSYYPLQIVPVYSPDVILCG